MFGCFVVIGWIQPPPEQGRGPGPEAANLSAGETSSYKKYLRY